MKNFPYPDNTPTQFSGAKSFVEQHGNEVWIDLCDSVPVGKWFNVRDTAGELESLKMYIKPERYLRAVLKALICDYNNRVDDYEHRPPVEARGSRMGYARV